MKRKQLKAYILVSVILSIAAVPATYYLTGDVWKGLLAFALLIIVLPAFGFLVLLPFYFLDEKDEGEGDTGESS